MALPDDAATNTIKKLIYDQYLKKIHEDIVVKIMENNEEIIYTDSWDSLGSFQDELVGTQSPVEWLIEKNPNEFYGSELGFFIRLINKENTKKVYVKEELL